MPGRRDVCLNGHDRTAPGALYKSGNCRRCALDQKREQKTYWTPERFARVWSEQAGLCAVCQKPFVGRPCADHNHDTLAPRGILCLGCNIKVGWEEAQEDRAAVREYLQNWKTE